MAAQNSVALTFVRYGLPSDPLKPQEGRRPVVNAVDFETPLVEFCSMDGGTFANLFVEVHGHPSLVWYPNLKTDHVRPRSRATRQRRRRGRPRLAASFKLNPNA